MSRRQQHGKGRKRRRSWHRGSGEAQRWASTELPDLGTGTPPNGEPNPVHLNRRCGNQNKGDAI
jgi:hypothetical protein